jgi:Ca2+-binding RTX toxin-like protein
MSTNVTVQGPRATTVTLTYDSSANALLAQFLANAITAGINSSSIIPSDSAFSGSPPSIPTGRVGEYVQDTPAVGPAMISIGLDDFIAPSTFNVLDNNPDLAQNLLAGTSSGQFIAQRGGGDIITGGGNDNIILRPSDVGSWLIVMGSGNDTVQAPGSGNDTIRVGAGNDSIQLGAGNSVVTTGGAATISGSSVGGAETVTGFNTDVIFGNASKLTFLATGGATVFGGTGADTVTGGNGPDDFQGGSGGPNSLTAGVGTATLLGASNGDQLIANGSGAQILIAGAGNETLTGSSVGGGNDTFVGGSGSATMAANTSDTNLFGFVSRSGSTSADLVTGLSDVSQAHVHLSGFDTNDILDVTSQNVVGGSLLVTLKDGTQVTFQNITAHLTSGNFS